MPDPWWICVTCSSLNRQKARKCYSCGSVNEAGQAEVIDLLDSGFIGRRSAGPTTPPPVVTPADAVAKGAVDQGRVRAASVVADRAAVSPLLRPSASSLAGMPLDGDEPLLKPVQRPPAFVPAVGDGPTGVEPYVPQRVSSPVVPKKRRIDWRFGSVTLLAVVVVSFFFAALTFAPSR